MNLRMNLLDTVHRNEELSEFLAQKEQQLEQQDKTSRAQARVIKVTFVANVFFSRLFLISFKLDAIHR